jgi:tetratricopeptide (TPR) repeat protein
LADAFAEHRAGDLSDEDYQALRRRDTARLAALDLRMAGVTDSPQVADVPEVENVPATGEGAADGRIAGAGAGGEAGAEAEAGSSRIPRPKRSRRQRLLLGGGVAALIAALVVVVSVDAAHRLPGQTISGNIALSRQQQVSQTLAQAAVLVNRGQTGEAARLYQQVLGQQPNNEVALAQLGWLEYETGVQGSTPSLVAQGRTDLERAVTLAPTDFAARLYLGTVLLQQDNNAAGAVAQYERFLAANPPTAVLQQAAGLIRKAYTEAGVPVPAQVPAQPAAQAPAG